jgi:hypothetical protein
MSKKLLLLLLLSLLFSSCGWHVSNSFATGHEETVSIPYVMGDHEGILTAALAEQFETSGPFRYVQEGGTYTLNVELVDTKSQNIGFRYNPRRFETGIKKQLIPSETRRRTLAKVTLIETASQKVISGPAYITGFCEFDHQNYSINHDTNRFSLGQLTDIDTTYEAVNIPLYRSLAQNICHYIENLEEKEAVLAKSK